jgi:hypothetical protein
MVRKLVEANVENMFMLVSQSHHQNVDQDEDIKISKNSFEIVPQLKYL